MLRVLVVCLFTLGASARANDVQNIYDQLPKVPTKVADELDCRTLSDASAAASAKSLLLHWRTRCGERGCRVRRSRCFLGLALHSLFRIQLEVVRLR
jgi:hypothetical protein